MGKKAKHLRRIDSKEYLKSYGWKEGEALKNGGLKKPILVKHKRDRKGLGTTPGNDDSEAWWERLFDGQLKSLDVSTGNKAGDGIVFKQNKVVASSVSKQNSPLYQWFVKGEGLKGTINSKYLQEVDTKVVSSNIIISDAKNNKKKSKEKKKSDKEKSKHKRSRGGDDDSDNEQDRSSKSKRHKKSRKEKKQKSDKKEKDKKLEKKKKKHKKKNCIE